MAIRLLSSDIDGTVLGNPEAAARLREAWLRLDTRKRPCLCYNTGRLLDDTLALVARNVIPEPDYLICGVGTTIYDCRRGKKIEAFDERLREAWDRDRIQSIVGSLPGIEAQPPQHQNPFKSSWYWENASKADLADLRNRLAGDGEDVHVVYSSDVDLDILPRNATKGRALQWLLDQLDIPVAEALAAGDTGNDSAMFEVPGIRGILPANARRELREITEDKPVYRATREIADGVIEGLVHYGVMDEAALPA